MGGREGEVGGREGGRGRVGERGRELVQKIRPYKNK